MNKNNNKKLMNFLKNIYLKNLKAKIKFVLKQLFKKQQKNYKNQIQYKQK